MKFNLSSTRRLLQPVQRLFQRTRAGSVLILVIALLVLLALMGTAYISTARTERYSSQQHIVNTQIDLLLQGVENLTASTVVGKLYDPAASAPLNYRLAANSLTQYTYKAYDCPTSDLYLSSRLPEMPQATAGDEFPAYWTTNAPVPPMWRSVSYPTVPLNLLNTNANIWQFDTPTGVVVPLVQPYSGSTNVFYNQGDIVGVTSGAITTYYAANSTSSGAGLGKPQPGVAGWTQVDPKQAFEFFPTSTTVNGQTVPALYIYNTRANGGAGAFLVKPNSAGYATGYTTGASGQPALTPFLAADADGDGIADTGLFKLPISPIDGVTYYAGVRVIDNNSAFNASTAWTCSTDVDYSAGNDFYLGMSRADVGLQESLTYYGASGTSGPTNEMTELNDFRFGFASTVTNPKVNQTPYYTQYNTSARADFTFLNGGDAMENELIRRTLNPGYNLYSTAPYQFLGNSATIALANHFCLERNSSASSAIETYLPAETLPSWGRTTPYPANDVGTSGLAAGVSSSQTKTWYGDNFDFIPPSTPANPYNRPSGANQQIYAPERSIIVGSNPVANAASGHYVSRGTWATGLAYHFGDWVTASNNYSYVCIEDHTSGGAGSTTDPSTFTPYVPIQVAGVTYQTPNTVDSPSEQYWAFVPWTKVPTRASANTANFGELWAAYWNVMWDHSSASGVVNAFPQPAFGYPLLNGDTTSGYVTNQAANGNIAPTSAAQNNVSIAARMFRSPIRDPGNNQSGSATAPAANSASLQYMTPGQTMLLRSALAAINTISLRQASGSNTPLPATAADGLDNVVSRMIQIPADPNDPNYAGKPGYNVMIFGATKQPYISEVYVTPSTTAPFIAIEICNPYSRAMTLNNWAVGAIDRSTTGYGAGAIAGAPMTTGVALPAIPILGATITTTGTGAQAASTISPGKTFIYDGTLPGGFPANGIPAPGLATLVGKELILLRPRMATGAPSFSTDQINTYNEGAAGALIYAEMVPVDQIDTGALPTGGSFEYRRGTASTGAAWNFVYPGLYSFLASVNYGNGAVATTYRQAGFQPATGQAFGSDKPYSGGYGTAAPAASYPTVSLQIANMDAAGWNQPNTANKNVTPFGGFMRNGDLLQVPFIGAYRILTEPNTQITTANEAGVGVIEMNSLPMDSAMADDEDPGDECVGYAAQPTSASTPPAQIQEQIGHFCPVGTSYNPAAPATPPDYDFHASASVNNASITNYYTGWRYHWAMKIFDYLTVQGAQNDYAPNADPQNYNTVAAPAIPPVGIANRNATIINAQTAGSSEDTVPLEGLVNINTAPWPVLAALPWYPAGFSNADPIPANASKYPPSVIAQDIVNYRNVNGPFQTIFDLLKVPAVKQLSDDMIQDSDPGPYKGAFTPFNQSGVTPFPTDGVRYDFAERFLLLNRISNLITTRSDSFTCYVMVQGWRNAGTNNATLVAQRRAAFLLDRSGNTPASPGSYTTIPIPQN